MVCMVACMTTSIPVCGFVESPQSVFSRVSKQFTVDNWTGISVSVCMTMLKLPTRGGQGSFFLLF